MKKPTAASGMLSRKGTRHPHTTKSSPDSATDRAIAADPSSSPDETPICGHEPKNPRRPGGAFSTAMIAAPPHSPPTAKPWARRSTHSRIGAAIPICANVGSNPMRAVATVITVNVRIRVDLRPIRSPRWPATKAPTGRARNPTPNVASAAIWAIPASN